MVEATSDLLAQFDAFCRTEETRLAGEAEELRERLDAVEAQRAQLSGTRRVFARFLEHVGHPELPVDGHVAPSPLGDEATHEGVGHGDDPPDTPPRGGGAAAAVPSRPLLTTPVEERMLVVARNKELTLRVRIAWTMGTDLRRSWTTQELAVLLYDDAPNRTQRETVRKTLERMITVGLIARHGGSYVPTVDIGDALVLADAEHVASDDIEITGEVLPIAN
jgi:hypothetical protein